MNFFNTKQSETVLTFHGCFVLSRACKQAFSDEGILERIKHKKVHRPSGLRCENTGTLFVNTVSFQASASISIQK